MREGEVYFQASHGSGKLPYNVSLLQSAVCEVLALLDNDKAGQDAWDQARKANLLTAKDVFFTVADGRREAEFEDLLADEWVKAVLLESYAVDLTALRKTEKSLKFSDRVKCAFKNSGKPFDEELKKEVKNLVAARVADSGLAAFEDSRLAPIKGLFKEVNRRL